MAEEKKIQNVSMTGQRTSELPAAKVRITEGQRLQVEFRIEDLVRRLVPGAELAGPDSSCGGCDGCKGCSM